jgi:hypothetical protein
VLDGLTGTLGSAKEEGVSTSGLLESELVKGEGLAASSEDACAGGGSEAQGSDVQLGNVEEAVVVGDSANNDDGFLLATVLGVGNDAGQRHRRPVDAAHKETAEHDLIEGRVGTA